MNGTARNLPLNNIFGEASLFSALTLCSEKVFYFVLTFCMHFHILYTGAIASHPLFSRVFGDFAFEVQPGHGAFVSVQQYNGCSYEFKALPDCRSIVINERYADGTVIELMPPEMLQNEVPHLLHQNYSHWWHKAANCIEFRPKCFADKRFRASPVEYKLDLNTLRLTQTQTGRRLLDVTSDSYRKLAKQLSRLECDQFVQVFVSDARPNVAEIELVRMHLKFETVDDGRSGGRLVSNEHAGMRVALKQNCGSLYGLQKGLILEPMVDGSNEAVVAKPNILLLPHGSIDVRRTGDHVNVDISVGSGLYTPPFHRYQVDEFGQQIRSSSSSYSAWLYLAYLHAVTSHGEVEPLLGMSGSERALQILQSG